MRIVVVENPAVARKLAPLLWALWPQEQIAMMPLMGGALHQPVFPRGLAYKQFPLVIPVKFKPAAPNKWKGYFNQLFTVCEDGRLMSEVQSFEQASETVMAAEHIVYMGDWDYSGVWGMEMLMRTLAPSMSIIHQVFILPPEHKAQDCQITLSEPIDSNDPGYLALYQAAIVKSYFEYNFHINGKVILGKLYRELSGGIDDSFLGRGALLATLRLEQIGEFPEDVVGYLKKWDGTGKYQGHDRKFFGGLGSNLSVLHIKSILEILKIIEHKDAEGGGYVLSQFGQEFASKIHKDCYDQDLPSRLDAWMGRPFDEVRPLIDKYILTFFRKQKRLQDQF